MAIVDLPRLISSETVKSPRRPSTISTKRLRASVAFIETKGMAVKSVPARPQAANPGVDWELEAGIWGDDTREWAESGFEQASATWPSE